MRERSGAPGKAVGLNPSTTILRVAESHPEALMEITPPTLRLFNIDSSGNLKIIELFSATRRKFGEVLLRADLAVPKPMDFSLLLGLRLPGQFLHIEGQTLQRIDTGTSAHVALFQFSSVCGG